MTREEALGRLGIDGGTTAPEEIRRAYLRRVKAVAPEVDLEGFARLREAYELLRAAGARRTIPFDGFVRSVRRAPGTSANSSTDESAREESANSDPFLPFRERLLAKPTSERVVVAREAVGALPDCVEARRALLAHIDPSSNEAWEVLNAGAVRQPEAFLDQLIFWFPARVPASTLRMAATEGSFGRLILLADAHAAQGRADEAMETFRAALAVAGSMSAFALRMALRPIFSMHAVGLVAVAEAAYRLLKEKAGPDALDVTHQIDQKTIMLYSLADELARLGPTLPLGLRQVAARAAKDGKFDLVPTAAGMATEALSQREFEHWRARIGRHAPAFAGLFRLDRAAKKKARQRRTVVFFVVPIAIALARQLDGLGTGSSGSTARTTYRTPALTSTDLASARVQILCRYEPLSDGCRDLRAVVADMKTDNGSCDLLRMRLDLIRSSAPGTVSSDLASAIQEISNTLALRCPP